MQTDKFIAEITPPPAAKVVREEPEKIKKWREEQKKRLEEKGKLISYILLSHFQSQITS